MVSEISDTLITACGVIGCASLTAVSLNCHLATPSLLVIHRHYLKSSISDNSSIKNLYLEPLLDIHLHSRFIGGFQPSGNIEQVYLFSAIGLFILLIACINYMNLATARSLNRAKEVGIKKVLGVSKIKLITQFLIESLLVATIALALTIFLMELFQPIFFNLTGNAISILFSKKLVSLLVATTIIVGLISGFYPAFFISSFKPAKVLKGAFRSSTSAVTLRKGLVALQFTAFQCEIK